MILHYFDLRNDKTKTRKGKTKETFESFYFKNFEFTSEVHHGKDSKQAKQKSKQKHRSWLQ